MKVAERLQTIAITATLTSALWIVAGSIWLTGGSNHLSGEHSVRTAFRSDGEIATQATSPGALHGYSASAPDRNHSDALMVPILGVSSKDLTDTFTDARADGARLHDAIDIMAQEGTSVVAAAPGKLEKVFLSDAGGRTLYVRSDDGQTIYYYAHLRDYAPGLNEGMHIRRGQRLGTVGHSGNADPEGPHLHFAIMRTTPAAKWWEPTTAVNPYPLLGGPRRIIAAPSAAAADATQPPG